MDKGMKRRVFNKHESRSAMENGMGVKILRTRGRGALMDSRKKYLSVFMIQLSFTA